MSDIGTLTAAASKAQAALAAEQEKQAAIAKADAEARQARSIEWAWNYVVSYNPRQVEASQKATDTMAALTEAVTVDLALAARLYLDVTREMAFANALGDELVKARSILKAAGELPGVYRVGHDPVGDNAPFHLTHGLVRFPSFIELVSETLDKQRAMASRGQSGETPETYEGKASDGLKAEALRREWLLAQEFELMLALREQHPDSYARLDPAQRAHVEAYARTRAAAGYDAPLPTAVVETVGVPEPVPFAPDETVRFRLYSEGKHEPSHPPTPDRW
ncbi:MAG TPA: hypothetical protein VIK08_06190 [Candidatus Limnocylindrales bacterium]